MKKIILIVLTILLTVSFSVSAENMYDLQQDKDWIDSEADQARNELNKQEELVDYYTSVIDKSASSGLETKEQLDQYEQWLAQVNESAVKLEQSIADNEQKYTEKLEQLKERIIDAYINSGVNLLDIISRASDINDVYEEIEVRKYLNDYDQKLLKDLVNLKLDLNSKRQEALSLSASYQGAIVQTNSVLETLDEISEIAKETVSASTASIEVQRERLDTLEAESAALENSILELQSKASYAGGDMIWPLPADRSVPTGGSKFGMRLHPIFKVWKMHTGVDLGAPWNANILAVNKGVVIRSGWSTGYGNCIIVDHGGGIATLYAHADRLMVSVGDSVKTGQVIALVGSTGYSTGPHLHFEVRVNGVTVDPMLYVDPTR